ncbi:MAG: HEAT repeat domain-containing protein [Leptospira sp.]|nr:HEAT repeat domain-containing protein [Leptospira sp.]
MNRITTFTALLTFGLSFSAVYSGEEGYFIPDTGIHKVNRLEQILLYGEPKEAAQAAEELAFMKSSIATRSLVTALQGPANFPTSPNNNPLIKFHSARALGIIGNPYAAKYLILEYNKNQEKIEEGKDQSPRAFSHIAMGNSIDSPYFFFPDDYTIVLATGEMLRALGKLEYTPEAETTLKDALKHKNYYIRASAADGLRLMERKENLGPLKEVVGGETDDYAKASILGAVCFLERGATESFKQLTDMLKSDSPKARMKASHYLGEIDLRLAEVPMEKALAVEDDPIVYEQMRKDFKKIMAFKYPTWIEN